MTARTKGLPVPGCRPRSEQAIVSAFKRHEERLLRAIDVPAGKVDLRWASIARTRLEQGFMALNHPIFQPGRIALPEDPQ